MGFHLSQCITYWSPGTEDQFGSRVFGTPTTLKGRWEDKIEQIVNAVGQTVVSMARIYLECPVEIDGYLYMGESDVTDPRTIVGDPKAWQIARISSVPNLSNLKRLYVAFI